MLVLAWAAADQDVGAAARCLANVDEKLARSLLRELDISLLGSDPGETLARVHETRWMLESPASRARFGVFYTPDVLVDALIDQAIASGARPDGIWFEPTAGTGAFVLGALRAFRRASGSSKWPIVLAMDSDADAIRLAHARWLHATGRLLDEPDADADFFICGDALDPISVARWSSQRLLPVDVVIGNPPFGNAIETKTGRSSAEKTRYSRMFPNAATGTYDRAGLFVERAVQVSKASGTVAMLLPRAIVSAPYAERLRAWCERTHPLAEVVDVDASTHFASADVRVAGIVLRGERESGDPRWSLRLSEHGELVRSLARSGAPTLGELCEIQASAATAEAYEFREHVFDAGAPESHWRLVTTGAIEPLTCEWGQSTQRYLKRRYETPWLSREAASARRAALYDSPKVLVAGLSRVLEAFADTEGVYAGAVATLAVRLRADAPPGLTLERVAALLNSKLLRAQYRALFARQELGGGSVGVTKKKLAELRIPAGLLARAGRDVLEWPEGIQSPLKQVAGTRDQGWESAVESLRAAQPSEVLALLDRASREAQRPVEERLGVVDACVAAL